MVFDCGNCSSDKNGQRTWTIGLTVLMHAWFAWSFPCMLSASCAQHYTFCNTDVMQCDFKEIRKRPSACCLTLQIRVSDLLIPELLCCGFHSTLLRLKSMDTIILSFYTFPLIWLSWTHLLGNTQREGGVGSVQISVHI